MATAKVNKNTSPDTEDTSAVCGQSAIKICFNYEAKNTIPSNCMINGVCDTCSVDVHIVLSINLSPMDGMRECVDANIQIHSHAFSPYSLSTYK